MTVQDEGGRMHTYKDYDLDYKPPMPSGAVRGDVRQQAFCSMCHVPRYFYVDQPLRCIQCSRDFGSWAVGADQARSVGRLDQIGEKLIERRGHLLEWVVGIVMNQYTTSLDLRS